MKCSIREIFFCKLANNKSNLYNLILANQQVTHYLQISLKFFLQNKHFKPPVN